MFHARIYSTCRYPLSPWRNCTVFECSFGSLRVARAWVFLMGKVANWFVVPRADGWIGIEWVISGQSR